MKDYLKKENRMNRKDEHLALAKTFYKEQENDFDQLRFVHHSFTNVNISNVNLSTSFLNWSFKLPFYINAMTGGSLQAKKINQQLGIIAKELDIMVSTGSVSPALNNPSLAETYQIIRKENPNGIIFANISAGMDLEQAKKAIDLFSADGLQIHVNLPQELVMPEGDCAFNHWLDNIANIANQLHVPIIIKEVGFGMSQQTIQQLIDRNIKAIDLSGQGGTSFTKIENMRREHKEFTFLDNFGQSTILSLLESQKSQKKVDILASGGIRNSFDIVKALSLGAKSVGIAGAILFFLMENGLEKTIMHLHSWEKELKILYTLLGKQNTQELTTTDIIFSSDIIQWCNSRNIDYKKLAQRSNHSSLNHTNNEIQK